jgi:hypothetical protein
MIIQVSEAFRTSDWQDQKEPLHAYYS